MKKILVLTVCLLVAVGLFGFEKGTKSLGGSISLGSTKASSGSEVTYGFGLSPAFSYFVTRNLCLDLAPGFNVTWGESMETSTSLGIDLGFRYFFKKLYAGASFDYYKSGPKGNKFSGQSMALKLGYMFEIAKNIYLDNGLVYSHGLGNYKYPNGSSENDSSRIILRTGIQIFFK